MYDKHGMALDAAHAAFDVAFNRRESANLIVRTTDGLRAALRAFLANVEPSDEMLSAAMHCLDGVNLKKHGRTAAERKRFKYEARARALSAKLADELDNKGE